MNREKRAQEVAMEVAMEDQTRPVSSKSFEGDIFASLKVRSGFLYSLLCCSVHAAVLLQPMDAFVKHLDDGISEGGS